METICADYTLPEGAATTIPVTRPCPAPATTAAVASDLPFAANCLDEAEVIDRESVVFSATRMTFRPVPGGWAVTADGEVLRQEWERDGGYAEEDSWFLGDMETSPMTLDLGLIPSEELGESWYDRLAEAAEEQVERSCMVGRAEGFEVLLQV